MGVLPERDDDSHKGEHGRVVVVGGSRRYVNTPGIVAGGALRTGVDLVGVAAPEKAATAAARMHRNIVLQPLQGEVLRTAHTDRVMAVVDDADVVVIGNGLKRQETTMYAVRDILELVDRAVIDGDGIHAAAEAPDLLEGHIVTPHAAEFAALAGEEVEDLSDRERAAREAAQEYGCTVLLKGSTDVIAQDELRTTNDTGDPSLTRGGTGDILAGLVGGLWAQGVEPFEAASEAARFMGIAGERAVDTHGPGYLLEELLDELDVA